MEALTAPVARVLVVGDDTLHRTCADAAAGHGVSTSLARTFHEATIHLAARDCDALVALAKRADGSALEWIVPFRDQPKWQALPVLVVAGRLSPAEVTRAFELAITAVCRPISSAHVSVFLTRESVRMKMPGAAALEELARRHSLSARETQLLAASLSGIARVDFIAQEHISLNTYKSLARKLLRKLRACTIGEVRDRLLRRSTDEFAGSRRRALAGGVRKAPAA